MAVTITYTRPSPVAGGTVAPTALQAQTQCVSADIEATADGDTDAVVTHNFGLSAAELVATKADVIMEPVAAEARLSLWIISARDANTITLTKATTGGSGGQGTQLKVKIFRPHSIISD